MRPLSQSFLWLGLTMTLGVSLASAAADKSIVGFAPASAQHEHEIESQFDASIQKENLRTWMKQLSAHPHHLGSAADHENAEFIANQFRTWGYDTSIEEFNVLFPTPKFRLVEMIEPEKFIARLSEPVLKEDSTSGQTNEQLPIYNAYSIDGDVTAEIVYVNYGVPKDYEVLAEHGIDVKGKIVLARYRGSWRGIKPKVAAEHGAIGCLIYSDPKDDGYFQGDTYPKGAWRPEEGAQRGSVADMPFAPGDPLTPGIGSTKDAQRLALKDAPTLTKIPVLPISYSDALPLLRALAGPLAPEEWRGALPLTYHLGPGPTKVHLKVEFNWNQVPAYDVVARLAGSERPEEWVIRGNHHDAWVNGASDPLSGMVVVMEEARAISELVKGGWRPKRTIVFTAWDGEEPGLLGSTEWAETHAAELQKHAVVYINSDGNGRGFYSAAGSQTLEKSMDEIAREVNDPEKNISVRERLKAKVLVTGTAEEQREIRERNDLRLSPMGSGSDYTPFLQHLGIPSLNIGYGGEGHDDGVYHSIYDSFDHFTRFVDPAFDYGATLARTSGRALLRQASADILPFEFTDFSESVTKYLKEVNKLADDLRDETKRKNKLIADGSYQSYADPTEKFVVPEPKEPVPFLNLAPIQNALARLDDGSRAYDAMRQNFSSGKLILPTSTEKTIDELLMRSDQLLLSDGGLPRRPWYKHQIYAPGFYTGYGVKTLPGVREAIEQRHWKEADAEAQIIAEAIDRLATQIQRAVAAAKSAEGR